MPPGHVSLNGYWFPLNNRQWTKVLADPMAARTAQGSPEYTDNTAWDYFVQTDWSNGVGEDVSDGTTLMSSTMSSWSKSNGLGFVETAWSYPAVLRMNQLSDWSITVGGASSTYEEINITALERDSNGDGASDAVVQVTCEFWVLGDGVTHAIDVKLYEGTDYSGTTEQPNSHYRTGSALMSKQILLRADVGIMKCCVTFSNANKSSIGTYADVVVSIQPQDEVRFVLGDAPVESVTPLALPTGSNPATGADWQIVPRGVLTDLRLIMRCDRNKGIDNKASGIYANRVIAATEYSEYSAAIYWANYTKKYWVLTDEEWLLLGDDIEWTGTTSDGTQAMIHSLPAEVVDWAESGEFIYAAFGSGSEYVEKIGTVANSDATQTYKADLIEVGGGWLWYANGETLYYTGDEVTWTPVDIGYITSSGILDITWFQDALYIMTPRSLYALVSGDIAVNVLTFDQPVSRYGDAKVWNSKMYWAANGQVYEYDGSTARPLFPSVNWGVRTLFGDVVVRGMYASNEFLDIALESEASTQYPTAETDLILLRYDGANLHMVDVIYGGANGNPVSIMQDYLVGNAVWEMRSPDNRTAWDWSRDVARGYIGNFRTGWMTGGLTDVDKDWESVKLLSHQLGSTDTTGTYAVWYQGDSNMDTWTYLGAAYINEEVRWPRTARPRSKKMRLGFVVSVNAMFDRNASASRGHAQPRIAAMRVKYHAMNEDRWRWDIVVPARSNMGMADGSVRDESVYELEEVLGEKIRLAQPFEYIDVDGRTYEVKVTAANVTLDALGRSAYDDNEYALMYRLTLEEMAPKEQLPRAIPTAGESDILFGWMV